jgi:LPXTG-site transpeptidase (sortase) family protein
VRIVIPAISTGANIIPVGVEKEGVMEVPPAQKAGWYKLGPVPGAPGPAVIVAHVYYNHDRDVFYQLKRLQPGDEIQVYDGSGDVALFVVDSREEVLKNELPTEKIWNQTAEPVLRLITCGGVFDPATRHYLSNVIVYAHLVE